MSFDPDADRIADATDDDPVDPSDDVSEDAFDDVSADASDGPSDDFAGRTAAEASRDVSPTSEDRTTLAALVPPDSRVRGALPGVAVAGFALVASGGALGLGAAAIVTLLWAIATPVYAATAAALLFVALEDAAPLLATDPVPLEALAAVGVGWLVCSPLLRTDGAAGTVGATTIGAVAAGAVVGAGLQYASLPVAAAALVAATALGLYAIHRYSVVRLAYRDLQ